MHMLREAIPSWFFVVIVVRKDNKFLLVHELKHHQKWYLPAGRIEPREDMIRAAERETLEETGVPVIVDGIIHIHHTPMVDGSARVRFIVTARPADDTPPKSQPDENSLGAAWMTLEQMSEIPLRARDVWQICQAVSDGAPVYPLSLISSEAPLHFGTVPNSG